ncbi:MAG TPA: tetratricopeptide repeat protein [Xanthobacteraceae bacterium]|nr:tetratricopeptide repeat protein [Xanthobacteraceae bacterium]
MRSIVLSAFVALSMIADAILSPHATADDLDTCIEGPPDQAIPACTRVVQGRATSMKDRVVAHYSRALAYRKKEENVRAIQDYDQAIKLDPKYANAYAGRCYARAIIDQLEGALADCQESLRLLPGADYTLDSFGFVYLKMNRLDDAIREYDAALKANPKIAASLFGRGTAKIRKGDSAAGNADIVAAITVNPGIAERMARYGIKMAQ